MKRIFVIFLLIVPCFVTYAQTTPKYVALTFDDGPSLTITPQILDLLEEYGATATFFVRGNKINEESAKVMQRAHRMGCEIGNHSWSHPHFSKKDEAGIRSEIEMADEAIGKYIGEFPRFLRPPFYDWDERVSAATDKTLIGGYCPNDFKKDVTAEERVRLTLEHVSDGLILLFHDSALNQVTADAMKTIVPELIRRGYVFVTVSELFRIRYPDGGWEHNKIYHEL